MTSCKKLDFFGFHKYLLAFGQHCLSPFSSNIFAAILKTFGFAICDHLIVSLLIELKMLLLSF